MSDQYKYDITMTCELLSLVYFTARSEKVLIQRIYNLIGSTRRMYKDSLAELVECKLFVFKKLSELDSKDEEIAFLDKQIDLERCLVEAFDDSLI